MPQQTKVIIYAATTTATLEYVYYIELRPRKGQTTLRLRMEYHYAALFFQLK